LSKAHHFPAWRADFSRAAQLFWQSYDDDSAERRAVRHVLGCLLARVDGRSPLEYLNNMERDRQRAVVLQLMAKPPGGIGALIDQFASCL
jgi:hypothetical protein